MVQDTSFVPSHTDAEIRELIDLSKSGDFTARETVLLAHLPLAAKHAKKYEGYGVPYDDLYQEACYGIMIALEKYDPTRPQTFGVYARHYIEKYIRDNAIQKQNCTLPSCYNRDFYYEIKAYKEAVEDFRNEMGREPSDEEMSEYLNFSLTRIRRLKQASIAFLTPSQELDGTSIDTIPASSSFRPVEDEVLRKVSPLAVLERTPALTAREQEVLERRLGLTESGEPETWAAIAVAMGISHDTAQNAFAYAIAKFRRVLGIV